MATRKWAINFSCNERSIDEPYGFVTRHPDDEATRASKAANMLKLQQKKVWEVARAPGMQLFMTVFMLWMAGSSLQIFSIMMIVYPIYNGIMGMVNSAEPFRPFTDLPRQALVLPRVVHVLLHGCSLLAGMYKLHTLGLLPTTPSDWHMYLPLKDAAEFSAGGIVY
eukprot:m51a1_g3053 hypothetical protein (166) ;mRNA; f:955862-956473